MADNPLTPEEQDRLYAEREKLHNGDAADCVSDDLALAPDVPPLIPDEKCDDPAEQTQEPFLSPNGVPDDLLLPDLLPGPLSVVSREATFACSADQVALSGTPDLGTDPPSVTIAAGEDVQLVYIDELEEIAQDELFRLAEYVEEMQAFVDLNLTAAIDAADFTTFDQGLADVAYTTLAVGTAIRIALVTAQESADAVAQTVANTSLVCGWLNQDLWVTCSELDPGYAISYTDPGDVEKVFVEAGGYQSEESQSDADDQAAVIAAIQLQCLVTNEEQTVVCSDDNASFDEALNITWPTSWVKAADASAAARGEEVVTLEDQGAETWDAAAWADMVNNTEVIELDALNGQEFMQISQVGSDDRRTLRTTVIIAAGDPRAAAQDLETANEIAYNLAIAELDCFVPNAPQIVACTTTGVIDGDEVSIRHVGLGLDPNSYVDRTTMYEELLGGDPGVYGGPEYARLNEGVEGYGTPGEEVDDDLAFEVRVWPGLFTADDEATALDLGSTYGSSFLQCLWISPEHNCQCVSTDEDANQETSTGPEDESSSFSQVTVDDEGVILDTSRSVVTNTTPRGLILLPTFPNKVANPAYDNPLEWPDLPAICQAALTCLFVACKTACCEPRPDEREYKINGMYNYATWGANWLDGPASLSDHTAFMAAWRAQLAASSFSACSDFAFAKEDYDSCDVDTPPAESGDDAIVHPGPSSGAYGTPARFKYGGILPWGAQWAEPGAQGGGDPELDPPDLLLPGTVKACSKADPDDPDNENIVQPPDPWGLFHCAEAYAEALSPVGLGETARQLAIGRLDCTHIAWPRHLLNCPQPNQKAFGPVVNLDLVTEGSSTQEANEQVEAILLPLLECRDIHNYVAAYDDGGALNIPGPTVANVGDPDNSCLPMGLSDATLYESDGETIASTTGLAADNHHIIISTLCVGGAVRLVLNLISESAATLRSEMNDAAQSKQYDAYGLPSGRAWVETLRMVTPGDDHSPHVWYIASVLQEDVGSGMGAGSDRRVVQAHTGPIILSETCCGDSSSSSEDSSAPSDSSSAPSSSDSSSGGSGVGSDKSTAIVPMPWHDKEFGALFTMESNEVLFQFRVRNIPIKNYGITKVRIDHRFRFVCVEGTLDVLGAPNPDRPAHTSAHIDESGQFIIIEVRPVHSWNPFRRKTSKEAARPGRVSLMLTGVRKGFKYWDMPERSRNQYDHNERHLNSIYPSE